MLSGNEKVSGQEIKTPGSFHTAIKEIEKNLGVQRNGDGRYEIIDPALDRSIKGRMRNYSGLQSFKNDVDAYENKSVWQRLGWLREDREEYAVASKKYLLAFLLSLNDMDLESRINVLSKEIHGYQKISWWDRFWKRDLLLNNQYQTLKEYWMLAKIQLLLRSAEIKEPKVHLGNRGHDARTPAPRIEPSPKLDSKEQGLYKEVVKDIWGFTGSRSIWSWITGQQPQQVSVISAEKGTPNFIKSCFRRIYNGLIGKEIRPIIQANAAQIVQAARAEMAVDSVEPKVASAPLVVLKAGIAEFEARVDTVKARATAADARIHAIEARAEELREEVYALLFARAAEEAAHRRRREVETPVKEPVSLASISMGS